MTLPLPHAPPVARAPGLCPSCDATVDAPRYCGSCGERRAEDQPRTVRALADEAWDVFSPVDGRIARTLWTLMRRPGALVTEYMRGARRRYVPPLRLFVVVNVVFFLYASFVGNRMYDTPLSVHVSATPYQAVARRALLRRVPPRAGEVAATYDRRIGREYAARFNRASTTQAKSLVISMVPMFAAILVLVEWRRRRGLLQDAVLALHTIALFLLLSIAAPWLVRIPLAAAAALVGAPFRDGTYDAAFGVVSLTILGVWTRAALRRVYGDGVVASTVKAVILMFGVAVVLMSYRALLFFTTLYATT